jgi:ABC-type Fe3+/spermidine/putrescine transport system ATPase subunit
MFGIQCDSLRDDAHYLIRPEEFRISTNSDGGCICTIEKTEFYGFYRTIAAVMQNGKKIRIKDVHRMHHTDGGKIAVYITKKSELILLNEFTLPEDEVP